MPSAPEKIGLSEVDTYLFDYGGVVSFHYCEPWQGNLSKLLGVSPKRVRELLSESSDQGRNYRTGAISRDEFWTIVMSLASAKGVDIHELEDNWARSYQIDHRMLRIIDFLRQTGNQVGVVMNTDEYRHSHIEQEYRISEIVDAVISSCEQGCVKPQREAYLGALRIMNRERAPHKTVYFDDRLRNIEPCLELGMKGMVFEDFEQFQKQLIAEAILPLDHND
ncbi:MAG: HAD hydrolase-like protein [Candidatus Peribacteraceae bacterium]|nr:HAD hydrolase-like protein [Candidatus Peribacteraceae bacterium]